MLDCPIPPRCVALREAMLTSRIRAISTNENNIAPGFADTRQMARQRRFEPCPPQGSLVSSVGRLSCSITRWQHAPPGQGPLCANSCHSREVSFDQTRIWFLVHTGEHIKRRFRILLLLPTWSRANCWKTAGAAGTMVKWLPNSSQQAFSRLQSSRISLERTFKSWSSARPM
jgi:hypothetical protein